MKRDWSGYKLLKVLFYGDPNNDAEPMYVGLEDGDGTLVTIAHPNPDLTKPWWQDWFVVLSEFTDKDSELALSDIAKIYIGFGDKDNPQPGGSGVVFFDDIRLFAYGVCIPGTVVGDFDDDCTVNNSDLELMTELWLGETPTGANPIIKLDTTGMTVGNDVTTWSNAGTAGGQFDANSSDSYTWPKVETVAGRKVVTFDSNDFMVWNQLAPAGITGNSDWTVIIDVWNLKVENEEWVIGWSKRGTEPNYAAIGYGTNPTWGAAAHWGAPDMGFDGGVPSAHTWHTIAVTYEGGTNGVETIIVDGIVNATEAKTLNIWDANEVTLGTYDANSTQPMNAINYKGSVSKIEVYDYAMAPGELAIKMGSPADLYPDDKIDFKDLAVLGDNWMQEAVLLGD